MLCATIRKPDANSSPATSPLSVFCESIYLSLPIKALEDIHYEIGGLGVASRTDNSCDYSQPCSLGHYNCMLGQETSKHTYSPRSCIIFIYSRPVLNVPHIK